MKQRTVLLLSLVSLVWGGFVASAAEIHPRIQDFETYLEKKIRENLTSLLGPHALPIVMVKVKETPPLAPTQKTQQKQKEFEVGYVPIPVVGDFWKQNGGEAVESEAQRKLDIDAIEVTIQIPKEPPEPGQPLVDDSRVIEAVTSLVKKMLEGLNPEVRVSRPITLPEKPKKDPEPPVTLQHSLPLIAAIVASAILALGILSIAFALRRATLSISEGFLQLKTHNTDKVKSVDEEKENEDKKSMALADSPEAREKGDRQAIRVLKQIISNEPTLFTRSIGENDSDARGLRRLLPFLDDKEQENLRSLLGPEFLDRLSKIDELPQGEDAESMGREFSQWLQNVSEKVVLRRIQGGSELERILGTALTMKLLSVKPDVLIAAAKKVNSKPAWRVAAEFLPKAELSRALADGGESQWRLLVEAAGSTPGDVDVAAKELIEAMGGDQSEEATMAINLKQKYYSAHLLDPVVSAVGSKALGEDDAFLDQMAQTAPDFVKLVRDKVWTPKDFARVPDSHLGKVIKNLDNDERVALIVALPQIHSDRVRQLVPEGNARTIVLDKVKKVLAKSDPEQMRKFTDTCRQILSALRQDAIEGKFKPADQDGGTSGTGISQMNTRSLAA